MKQCGKDPRDLEFIGVSKDAGRTVGGYGVDKCERVCTHVCMLAWERLLASIDSGIFENKYGDVASLTICHG
ncbi:MAG: hypothetical protein LBB15_00600 [Puniceicoccales bacterium]|nr:hypothetical protein [Puniceicoccales bacterium]